MGLDMYLYAEVSEVHFSRDEQSETHKKMRDLADELGLPQDNVGKGNYGHISMEVQAGYWRKANHIHNWFVQNVQDGVDECQRSYVEISQLTELKELCQKVVKTAKLVPGKVYAGTRYSGGVEEVMYNDGMVVENADEVHALLPTSQGFFFGSSNVDEWYMKDVEHTIKVVEACEKLHKDRGYRAEFHYQSSW